MGNADDAPWKRMYSHVPFAPFAPSETVLNTDMNAICAFEQTHPGLAVRTSKGASMLIVRDRYTYAVIATVGRDCGYPTLAALSEALIAGKHPT